MGAREKIWLEQDNGGYSKCREKFLELTCKNERMVNQKLGRPRMHVHPDSASQRPECNGPAPHCPARLFDHGARPAR